MIRISLGERFAPLNFYSITNKKERKDNFMDRVFWDQRYKQKDYIYGTEPNSFLKASLSFLPEGGNVLCLSEGEGRNGVFLSEHGFKVTGVDISVEGKKKAERLAAERHTSIDYVICDLNDFDFGENSWDGVISIFAHFPRNLRNKIHEKTIECMKDGGVFLFQAYHPKQLDYKTGGPPDIDMLVTLDELKKTFADYEIIQESELETKVIEGSSHTGTAFVTQFICKK